MHRVAGLEPGDIAGHPGMGCGWASALEIRADLLRHFKRGRRLAIQPAGSPAGSNPTWPLSKNHTHDTSRPRTGSDGFVGGGLDYDAMDHSAVNRVFVQDFLAVWDGGLSILDVGTGTAQIPIELCRQSPAAKIVAIDLAAAHAHCRPTKRRARRFRGSNSIEARGCQRIAVQRRSLRGRHFQ